MPRSRYEDLLRGSGGPLAALVPGADQELEMGPSQVGQPPGTVGEQPLQQRNPLLELANRTALYRRRSGRQSLLASGGELIRQPGGESFGTTAAGPRAGQMRQSFKLPGGKVANVYLDAKGRRKVFVFTPGARP